MKNLFIVANWKSNKSTQEAQKWLEEFNASSEKFHEKKVIVCPPFMLLPTMNYFIKTGAIGVTLGAQDISPFGEGAYTGEVNGKQVKEFADYVLIGHSERRKYFYEDEKMIEKKVQMALQNNLIPILCVQDDKGKIPQGVTIVAYEPLSAIGTGNADDSENANRMAGKVKTNGVQTVIYGGSVTAENVHSFTSMSDIDGVLSGGASLDVQEFTQIIRNA